MTVNPVNDAPVAVDDDVSVDEDNDLILNASSLLAALEIFPRDFGRRAKNFTPFSTSTAPDQYRIRPLKLLRAFETEFGHSSSRTVSNDI